MSAVLPRAAAVLEALTAQPDGLALGTIAEVIDAPKSATHRLVTELIGLGYVSQDDASGNYRLGLSVISQALRHLAAIPLMELARPLLDGLAAESGELARLGLPDGRGSVVWVAKAQGARRGLRYDPDDGRAAKLARTSTGTVWLSTLPRPEAIGLLTRQGFDDIDQYGPVGPTTLEEALVLVDRAREDGYCYTDSIFEVGTAVIAVPVRSGTGPARAVLSIAGPSVRLTQEYAISLLPSLTGAAERLVHLVEHPA